MKKNDAARPSKGRGLPARKRGQETRPTPPKRRVRKDVPPPGVPGAMPLAGGPGIRDVKGSNNIV